MNWPFVLKSKYTRLENKYNKEITDLKERNELLTLDNTKLRVFANEESIKLLFDKKDLKQKIRKLESENSKLKSKNEALDSHCKWLYGNFRRFKEQIEKSGYFKD